MKNTIIEPGKVSLRQRAEIKLKTEKVKFDPEFFGAETLKLIHELEVHQIELEMQNEELLNAKIRAEIAEEKYIELYDFAPSGYLTLSKSGNIEELNFCAAHMLGNLRSSLVNLPFEFFISENTRAIFNAFIQRLYATKLKESCEVTILVQNSFPLFILIEGLVSKNDENCFLTIVDLTERKESERNLLAKEKAEESDRLKTAFLQNMSHEIRTPLNAIMGFSDILPEYFDNRDKLNLFSGIIRQRGADLIDIISDILDVAKIESGQLPVHLESANLTILFSEIETFYTEYRKRINKEDIKFNLKLDCSILNKPVILDNGKLKQILINLITNAFKFTMEGSVELGCNIEKRGYLSFYVSDTGIGIPKDNQSFIFERFTQANPDTFRKFGGTGLGLAIVKGLLDLLGGKIWLESEPGRGSTFFVLFPYQE